MSTILRQFTTQCPTWSSLFLWHTFPSRRL